MPSVIVTGASGFVGAALVASLRQSGHDVLALDHGRGEVSDAAYWNALPSAAHVVHLAGRSYVPESWKAQSDFLTTNVVGTARATEYCRRTGAHLVFASAYVYGIPVRLPIDEGHPIAPNNPYALSKALAERVCVFHAGTARLPVTIVRPFNIFGPGQRADFLIPMILDQIAKGCQIRVKDLAPKRDYLFIDDLIAGIERTLEQPGGLRVINFGSGISYTVKEIIDLAQEAAGSHLSILCDNEPRPNEISDVWADIGRAHRLLGWEPRQSLADGLKAALKAARR